MPQDSDQNIPQLKQPEPVFRSTWKQLEREILPLKLLLFPLIFVVELNRWLFRWLCIQPWMKLAAFPVLLVIPMAFLWILGGGAVPFHYYVNWGIPVSPEEAAPYESPLRGQVCPVLKEKYGLEECEVKYTRPGKCKSAPEDNVVGMLDDMGGAVHFKIVSADHKRRIEIAQDIIRMKRELPGLPKCPYVLEFDQPNSVLSSWDWKPDGAESFDDPAARAVIAAIVIPDGERGYDGRGDWHFDDFTPTPGRDEEARQ